MDLSEIKVGDTVWGIPQYEDYSEQVPMRAEVIRVDQVPYRVVVIFEDSEIAAYDRHTNRDYQLGSDYPSLGTQVEVAEYIRAIQRSNDEFDIIDELSRLAQKQDVDSDMAERVRDLLEKIDRFLKEYK